MTLAADSQAEDLPDDRRARRNVIVLVAATAILGSQIPLAFVVAALAGSMLTPLPCLATLPVTVMVLGAALSAPGLSGFMQKRGRRAGFVLGTAGGLAGSALSAWGLSLGSFALFVTGCLLTGSYMATQGFFRFAATDTASDAFRPKAISWVMAGGLLSAIAGPQLAKATTDLFAIPFLGSYVVAIALNLLGVWLFFLLDLPARAAGVAPRGTGPGWAELLARPPVLVAVICGAVAYALMNLVMTSAPLAVVGCGFTPGNAADVISVHVLAMFVPSFFTGHLIARFGAARIVMTGLAILALAGVTGIAGVNLSNFFAGLALLGLGWNFGFIGATAMLAEAHRPEERGIAQGMNDAIVMGAVTVASLASGGLMNCVGSSAVEGWQAVNIAMTPFLVLAGAALIWLRTRGGGPA
ncbi:Arabinose efflux permease [Rubellimicrobium thermophilum DSM 16684]|uniref:Arabinose efflux permease n=1 Tax=Rubellimicrobium thermophilum DSM 16684 TaxID=1123069 RepID=S9R3E5_9RHOB|nr:MFS transporter [Rubellimicrobium thermophilum]EPX86442.1 Arabinose efflux permease [Rubellimicrobium thermophilum DSM 16684]